MDLDLEEFDRQKAQKARAFKPALKPVPRSRPPGQPAAPSAAPTVGAAIGNKAGTAAAQLSASLQALLQVPTQRDPTPIPDANGPQPAANRPAPIPPPSESLRPDPPQVEPENSRVSADADGANLAGAPPSGAAGAPASLQQAADAPTRPPETAPSAADGAARNAPAAAASASPESKYAFNSSFDDLLNLPSQPRQSKFAPSAAGRRGAATAAPTSRSAVAAPLPRLAVVSSQPSGAEAPTAIPSAAAAPPDAHTRTRDLQRDERSLQVQGSQLPPAPGAMDAQQPAMPATQMPSHPTQAAWSRPLIPQPEPQRENAADAAGHGGAVGRAVSQGTQVQTSTLPSAIITADAASTAPSAVAMFPEPVVPPAVAVAADPPASPDASIIPAPQTSHVAEAGPTSATAPRVAEDKPDEAAGALQMLLSISAPGTVDRGRRAAPSVPPRRPPRSNGALASGRQTTALPQATVPTAVTATPSVGLTAGHQELTNAASGIGLAGSGPAANAPAPAPAGKDLSVAVKQADGVSEPDAAHEVSQDRGATAVERPTTTSRSETPKHVADPEVTACAADVAGSGGAGVVGARGVAAVPAPGPAPSAASPQFATVQEPVQRGPNDGVPADGGAVQEGASPYEPPAASQQPPATHAATKASTQTVPKAGPTAVDILARLDADLDALPKQQRRAAPTVVARRRPGAPDARSTQPCAMGTSARPAAAATAAMPVAVATAAVVGSQADTAPPPSAPAQPTSQAAALTQTVTAGATAAPAPGRVPALQQRQQQPQEPAVQATMQRLAALVAAGTAAQGYRLAPRDPRPGPVVAPPGQAAMPATQPGPAAGVKAAVADDVGAASNGEAAGTTARVDSPTVKRRRVEQTSAAANEATAAAGTESAGGRAQRGQGSGKRSRKGTRAGSAAGETADVAGTEGNGQAREAGKADAGPPAKRARSSAGEAKAPRQQKSGSAGTGGGRKGGRKVAAVSAEERRRQQLATVAATTQLMFRLVQSAGTHSSKKGAMAWVRLLSTMRSNMEKKKLVAARAAAGKAAAARAAAGSSVDGAAAGQTDKGEDLGMALIVHPDHQPEAEGGGRVTRGRRGSQAKRGEGRAAAGQPATGGPRVPKPRSQGGSVAQEAAAAAAREARVRRQMEAEALQEAGLQAMVLPRVDPKETIDPETWSLRRIIARTQAWEKAKMADEKAAAKAAALAAAEAAAAAGGGGGAAAALPARPAGVAGGGGGGVPAAPQVRIVNGQLVVDTSSLTVTAQQRDDVEGYARVEEDTRYVTSFTYMKRLAPARWSEADTALFYRALAAFGTDFSLICLLFPEMQRTHVKRKFTKELRENPNKVNAALAPCSAAGRGDNKAQLLEMVRARIAAVNEAQQAAGGNELPAPPLRAEEGAEQEVEEEAHGGARLVGGPLVPDAEVEEVVVGAVAPGGGEGEEEGGGGRHDDGGPYGGAYGGAYAHDHDAGGYQGAYGGYEDEYDAYY